MGFNAGGEGGPDRMQGQILNFTGSEFGFGLTKDPNGKPTNHSCKGYSIFCLGVLGFGKNWTTFSDLSLLFWGDPRGILTQRDDEIYCMALCTILYLNYVNLTPLEAKQNVSLITSELIHDESCCSCVILLHS